MVPDPTPQPGVPQAPIVEFRNVTVRYGDFTALNDISFAVHDVPDAGEFISIVGPSGCGKSTVLNLLAGLLAPTEGQILIRGLPIHGPGRDRGMIFQQYSSFPHLTVLRNVLFGLRINKNEIRLTHAQQRDRAMDLIRQVGLAGARAQVSPPALGRPAAAGGHCPDPRRWSPRSC